ncbi:MAG: GNAT family N-acetyltransferase [Phycisphaerales bacterium]|jgi:ribosomal protein S18 acetylase RimI-like enzyme|nr:GNAT family N-acetyltransferase [Phycisphaerales bacterium]
MHEVIVVPEKRRMEALHHLLEGRARSAIRGLEASGRLRSDWIWAVVSASGRLRSVGIAIANAGSTATILVSRPHTPAEVPLATAVIEAARAGCRAQPIDLLQALLGPDDSWSLEAYRAASFDVLADLHTLRVRIGLNETPPPLPLGVRLRTGTDAELVAVMEATYEATLDCASLRGLRRTQDILDGHRSGGLVHEDLVQILTRDSTPIGCAVVTCGPNAVADLAYIGLIPAARGCGLGECALRHMVYRAARHGARHMRLAVDDVNTPARSVYHRLGFTRESTQRAVIHSVRRLQVGRADTEMSTAHRQGGNPSGG